MTLIECASNVLKYFLFPQAQVPDSSLFVAKWDPNLYLHGMHRIEVKARDKQGKERSTSHVFSFDGSKPAFGLRSKLIMNVPHQAAWGTGFMLVLFASVVPLIAFRIYDLLTVSRKFRIRCQQSLPFYLSPFAKVYLLTCVDRIFLPVICIPLYLSFGPWMIGHVITGNYKN